MTRREYQRLRLCFRNWTTSPVQTDAWKYRHDFRGFCRWFLAPLPPRSKDTA